MKQNKLNIFLIKEKYKNFDEIINETKNSKLSSKVLDNSKIFYYEKTSYKNAPWIDDFFLDNLDEFNREYNVNPKGLLLTEIDVNNEKRFFAITFGRSKTFLDDNSIEYNFGIKTTLNLIKEESIRSITKINVGGNNKNAREQMPYEASIIDFGLDINSDLIKAITGVSSEKDIVTGNVTGSDYFSCSVPANINNIEDFLKKIYLIYKSDNYKTKFPWIDQIQSISSSEEINNLDSLLFEKIMNEDENIWMAVPEIIDWDLCKGFTYGNDTIEEIHSDIYIKDALHSFKKSKPTSIQSFKNKKVNFIDSGNNEIKESWTLYNCLVGEISIKDETFSINNSKWYRVERDYVKDINNRYMDSKISDINFIDYVNSSENPNENKSEAEYNKELAKANPNDFLCLDGKLVSYGKGYNKNEICDILSKNNALIHIKRYSGSGTLSHLFNQGFVSAELIRVGNDYIDKANEVINNNEYNLSKKNNYNIVFGIISDGEDDLPEIPFFSKITFLNISERLKGYNFDVSIKRIRKIK